jgi:hypothetical protein
MTGGPDSPALVSTRQDPLAAGSQKIWKIALPLYVSVRVCALSWPRQMLPVFVGKPITKFHSVDNVYNIVTSHSSNLKVNTIVVGANKEDESSTLRNCKDEVFEHITSARLTDTVFGCRVGEDNFQEIMYLVLCAT